MIDPGSLLIFTLAGIGLNVTPGPDMVYVATRTVGQGRSAGVVSSFGIAAGSLVHMTAAAFGLSALFAYSDLAYHIVKYLGAAYMIYLGVRILLSPLHTSPLSGRVRKRQDNLVHVFWQGALTNLLNPKVALFFISFLPQFVDPSRGPVATQILMLGLVFNITGTTVNVAVAYVVGFGAGWLQRSPRIARFQQWFAGSVLVALGVRLAIPNGR